MTGISATRRIHNGLLMLEGFQDLGGSGGPLEDLEHAHDLLFQIAKEAESAEFIPMSDLKRLSRAADYLIGLRERQEESGIGVSGLDHQTGDHSTSPHLPAPLESCLAFLFSKPALERLDSLMRTSPIDFAGWAETGDSRRSGTTRRWV